MLQLALRHLDTLSSGNAYGEGVTLARRASRMDGGRKLKSSSSIWFTAPDRAVRLGWGGQTRQIHKQVEPYPAE